MHTSLIWYSRQVNLRGVGALGFQVNVPLKPNVKVKCS